MRTRGPKMASGGNPPIVSPAFAQAVATIVGAISVAQGQGGQNQPPPESQRPTPPTGTAPTSTPPANNSSYDSHR